MFKRQTVIVLGAGASHDFGLPLGSALKEGIAKEISFRSEFGRLKNGDNDLYSGCQRILGTPHVSGPCNQLAQVLKTCDSTDDALDFFGNQPELIAVGKLGIAMSILRSERRSKIPTTNVVRQKSLPHDGSWASRLFALAINGARQDDVSDIFQNLTIIDFNYDRVLEHFLFLALTRWTGVTEAAAQAAMSGLTVLKPYGSLGPLEWQGPDAVQFGGDDWHAHNASQSLRTFTEQVSDAMISKRIKAAISSAKTIIFLGFGFHPQNMEMLSIDSQFRSMLVFATKFKVNSHNDRDLRRNIAHSIRCREDNIELVDMTASDFFRELSPAIKGAIS